MDNILVPAPTPAHNPDRDRLRRIGRKVRDRLAANPAVYTVPTDKAEIFAVGNFFDEVECGRLMAITDAANNVDLRMTPRLAIDRGRLVSLQGVWKGRPDPRIPHAGKYGPA